MVGYIEKKDMETDKEYKKNEFLKKKEKNEKIDRRATVQYRVEESCTSLGIAYC